MKITHRVCVAIGLATLTACSGNEQVAEASKPFMVVHPVAISGSAVTAFPGEIRARHESALSFRISGKLLRRDVEAGQSVKAGQVLAVLDSSDAVLQVRSAQAQLAAARAEANRAGEDLERFHTLAEQQLISASMLDQQTAAFAAAKGQLDAARANAGMLANQVGYASLRAPAAGVIATRDPAAEAGQVVAAGQTLFLLAGNDGREVRINLPEAMLTEFPVGTAVQVESWSAKGLLLPGKISEVAAAADPLSRTYAARVRLADGNGSGLALGQSVRVTAVDTSGPAVVELPLPSVRRGTDGKAIIWVVDARTSRVNTVPVTVIAYGHEAVTLTGAVTPEDWVVAAGGSLLRAGQKITPLDREHRPVVAAVVAGSSEDGQD